jgi:NAD(P)H-dependent FMN reductase
MTLRLLAFAASLRKDSLNRKLIRVAADLTRASGAEVDLADFHQFDMPLFDGDILAAQGIPAGAQEMIRRIGAADGLVISSPEYNYSLPGTLKNAIDWVSRAKPMPLRGRSALLLGASTSQVGAIRGLWQLRIPLEGLGVWVHPDMYSLPWAEKQFDEQGGLKEPERLDRLKKLVGDYVEKAGRLAGSRTGAD